MPLYNNKNFPKVPGQLALLKTQNTEKNLLVFYHKESNSVFENYEDYTYIAKIFKSPVWQCKFSGKDKLTYKQAHELEQTIEIELAERLSLETRKEILEVNKKTTPIDKDEKKNLIERIIDDIFRFKEEEIVSYKTDKNNLYRQGVIVSCSFNNKTIIPTKDTIDDKLKKKDENYTIWDLILNQLYTVSSDLIKHEGLLSSSNRRQLRSTVIQWIGNIKYNLNVYAIIKKGIPTQSNFSVVIPPVNKEQLLINIKMSTESMKNETPVIQSQANDLQLIHYTKEPKQVYPVFKQTPLNKLLYSDNTSSSKYQKSYDIMQAQKGITLSTTSSSLPQHQKIIFNPIVNSNSNGINHKKRDTNPTGSTKIPSQAATSSKAAKKPNTTKGDEARERLKIIEQERLELENRLKLINKEKTNLEKKIKKGNNAEKKLQKAKEEEAKKLAEHMRLEAIKQEELQKAEELRQKELLRVQMEIERQKAYEASIVYPVEDLEVLPKFVSVPRPQPTPIKVESPLLFEKLVKVWSFLNIYSEHFGFSTKPLMDLELALRQSFTTKDAVRYPIEHLVTQMLECIIAEGKVMSNLWIPEGINDLEYYPNGLTIEEIGDWQKAELPITNDKFGLVLLGALKELYCAETLLHGQDIIKFLEQGGKSNDTELLETHRELVERNMKAYEKVDYSRKTRNMGNRSNKVSYKEVPVDSSPQSSSSLSSLSPKENANAEDEAKATEEAILQKRKQLESDVQLAYYGLPFDWHLDLLVFLIEMAAGTTRIRGAIELNFAKESELRKDRTEFNRAKKINADQIIQLNTELFPLQKAYALFHDPDVDTKLNLGNGFAKIDSNHVSAQPSPQKQPVPQQSGDQSADSQPQLQQTSSGPSAVEVDPAIVALVPTTRKGAIQLNSKITTKVTQRNKLLDANTKLDTKIENANRKIYLLDNNLHQFRPLGRDRFYNTYYFIEQNTFKEFEEDTDSTKGPKLVVEANFTDPALSQFTGYPIDRILQRKGLCKDAAVEEQNQSNLPSYAYYNSRQQVIDVIKWLNDKGQRERKLKLNLRSLIHQFPNSSNLPLPLPITATTSSSTVVNNDSNLSSYPQVNQQPPSSNGTPQSAKQQFTIQSWLQKKKSNSTATTETKDGDGEPEVISLL